MNIKNNIFNSKKQISLENKFDIFSKNKLNDIHLRNEVIATTIDEIKSMFMKYLKIKTLKKISI